MSEPNKNTITLLIPGLESKVLEKKYLHSLDDKLAKINSAIAFHSDWTSPETFKQKLKRLGQVVESAKQNNQKVIFVGVSAGAALAESWMLLHPHDDTVIHLYSLCGVLDPRLDNPLIDALTGPNPSFSEMVVFLRKNLHQKSITDANLPSKITVFSSKDDDVVPREASDPPWVKEVVKIGSDNHIVSIVKMLLGFFKFKKSPFSRLAQK